MQEQESLQYLMTSITVEIINSCDTKLWWQERICKQHATLKETEKIVGIFLLYDEDTQYSFSDNLNLAQKALKTSELVPKIGAGFIAFVAM